MTRWLATGDWIDPARIRLVCILLLVATLLSLIWLVTTANGTIDQLGRPIGTDFSNVYAAGWMAGQGQAAEVWLWPEHYRAQQIVHANADVAFFGWHYPPPFLLIATLLASLPYLPALALWQGITLGGAVQVARSILPGRATVLAALAAPATLVCLGHGQNAFLTAALLGGGILLFDRRPWMAGALLGCLVYKPQFAVLLPIVIVAAGNWRAFAGAALSSLALVGVTLALWGWPVWQAFIDSLPLTKAVVIEGGGTGWHKIASPFAAVSALGAPVPLASAVQMAATAIAVIGAAAAARWGSRAVLGGAVCAAAILSTPYVLDYDLVILTMALPFLVVDARERGWLDWEKAGLAAAFLAPMIGRQVAMGTLVPLNLMAATLVFGLAMRRLWLLDLGQRFDWRMPARI